LGIPSINDAGQVAVYGSTYCSGVNACGGVFSISPTGSVTKIIDGGGPALGYPYQTFGDAIINHGGAVSFGVQNTTSGNTASSMWLDLWKLGTVRQVAPTRALTPGVLVPYLNARLLNNSKVLYAATDTHTLMTAVKGKPPQPAAPGFCTASNATGSSLNGWIATAGGPVGATCVSTGILVTQLSTVTTQLRVPDDGTYGQLRSATVNASGAVAFVGRSAPGHPNVEALYLLKVGAAAQKLNEIDNGTCANAPPLSGTCQYRAYANSLAVNVKGQILTNVQFNTWTAGNPIPQTTGNGVALNGDALNGQVIWPGMVVNGCTVVFASNGPRAINKYGQIVLALTCVPTPGIPRPNQQIVVATPPVK
jgi:hypothetical protein